ncbi:MAG: hypothetical protein JW818_01295 [Pirellulales bacterium]|nr:hypothetical protein [Pirellulales bacterium]
MANAPDVYREWLGITEAARPLNHYQLLRLKQFEDDAAKIRTHYRKMNAHVRKYASGDYAAASQALLNELAKAMLCLTDRERKREYDASLGRSDAGELRRRSFEEILLVNKVVDQAQLDKARNYAKAVGLDVRDAVLQQKLAAPDVVMLAYAEAIGLPYIELDDVGVATDLVPLIPPSTARQHSCVPVMADEDQVLMASPNPLIPDVEDDLRLRLNKTIRTVLCTPASINAAVAQHYSSDAPAAVAPTPAGKPTKEKPAKEPKPAAAPTSAEQKKQTLLLTVVIFNLTIMLCIFLVFLPLRGAFYRLGVFDFVLTVLIATVAAVIAFFTIPKVT